ncbi:Guanine nucleotide-binding protein alpha-2 subunit [Platanthera guangdongensis]|uniref:Guanine nucleotide-binding protein alpha-2 subunit n=1 Tax=Platanthera guangdongensis TaxID=2320717 RepID=A0ABR2M602_9ASPA
MLISPPTEIAIYLYTTLICSSKILSFKTLAFFQNMNRECDRVCLHLGPPMLVLDLDEVQSHRGTQSKDPEFKTPHTKSNSLLSIFYIDELKGARGSRNLVADRRAWLEKIQAILPLTLCNLSKRLHLPYQLLYKNLLDSLGKHGDKTLQIPLNVCEWFKDYQPMASGKQEVEHSYDLQTASDEDYHDFAITYFMDKNHRETFMCLPDEKNVKWLRNRFLRRG